MENFEVIAEANSTDELSTVKQSLLSGKNLEGETKGKLESLAYDIQRSEGKKNSDIVLGSDAKEGSSKFTLKEEKAGSVVSKAKPESVRKVTQDSEVSNIEEDQKENASAEGEESEKEEQSESEISDQEAEYEKPSNPILKKLKYFEKLKNKKNFENKILLVNYQHQGDYEFFLKKLTCLFTLKPKMVILSYLDSEERFIKTHFFYKLAEVNDVKVVLVKQSDKEKLIEIMTVLEGKKKLKKKILDGIRVRSEILQNTIIYSWGSAFHGKLGIGRTQYFENNPEFKVATPVTLTKEYYEIANQHAHGKKSIHSDFYYRKFIYTYVPQIVLSNYGKEFKSIACGQNHSIALTNKEGLIYVWGDNTYSQLGIVTQSSPPKYDFPQTPTPAGSLASAREGHISSSSSISGGKTFSGTSQSKDSFVTIPRLHPKFSDYWNLVKESKDYGDLVFKFTEVY